MNEHSRYYDDPELSPEVIRRHMERAKQLRSEAIHALLARIGAGFGATVRRLGERLGRRTPSAAAKSAATNAATPAPVEGAAASSRRSAESRMPSTSTKGERVKIRGKAA
ncbi:MAG: hypothetical protein R3337_01270 [Gammaproteobacteria bacterium]|nr:hypothetical protein [Gammaproteobacteria bacterium]